MTDDDVQAARNLAYAMQLVMQGIGLAPAMPIASTKVYTVHSTSIPGTIIALCDQVAELREANVRERSESAEWKALYHGVIDRARIAEQVRDELEDKLCCYAGPCSNREPSDNPNMIGARCVRWGGHPPPCRWSRP